MVATDESTRDTSKPRRRTPRLETRFTLFVAALLLVLGVFMSLVIVECGVHQTIDEMRARMEFYGARSAPRLVGPLLARDRNALNRDSHRQAQGPNVVSVAILDAGGNQLAFSWGAAHGAAPLAAEPVLIPIVSPRDGRRLGTLVYNMASGKLAAASLHSMTFALVWLAVFIMLSIPLTIAMVRRATAPLRQLTAFAEQLTAQKLTMQIDIRSGDEFETLGRAFNHMTARLNSTMRRMHRIAYVDAVTDLPNGEKLLRNLDRAAGESERVGAPGALFLISVERASRAAEPLGPDATRDLIVAAAQRLREAVKTVDPDGENAEHSAPMVARVGAAEFAVLYPVLQKGIDLQALARSLVCPFEQPFAWREHRIALPAFAGAAFFPRDGRDADAVTRHARLALAAANADPQRFRFFTRALDRAAGAKLTLEREIRGALERNEFRAYFQPKVNLRNGRVEGAEALARWLRPDGGIIGPGKFIPAAEEMGLIGPISESILRDACWKGAAWSREGLAARVAVNVSALQFADDDFPAKVLKIAEQAGLPLQCLELEITESVAMEDVDRALRMIQPLRAAGVRFSIDDFGTGHSSLAALTRLPFSVLKIDQSFVRGLNADRQSAAIVETILAMAAALEYEVVAEGVETEEEAEFLRRRGCQIAQGFLFSAAQPPVEYLRILRAGSLAPRRGEKTALDPAA